MFMNDLFMSDFGAVYPIIISVIQSVPDHRNARQSGAIAGSRRVSTFFRQTIYKEAKDQHAKPFVWTKPEGRLNAALRLFVGSKETTWSNISEVSPGTS
jgi:hypothetical protein